MISNPILLGIFLIQITTGCMIMRSGETLFGDGKVLDMLGRHIHIGCEI
jgi:hypothetical protein